MGAVVFYEGGRAGVEAYLRSISGRYYVYLLCRPDGRPFYVGKGLNKRVLEHEAEARRNHPVGEINPFKCNVIRKVLRAGSEIVYRIDSHFDAGDELACLQREAALISQHGRLHEGGYLTNLAGGVGSVSGASPFSLERHAATLSGEPEHNPERATLNRFLQGLGKVSSVPIKPLSQISRVLPSTPHPQARSPTVRSAYALVASAAAWGIPLSSPSAVIPRAFTYQNVRAIIENGVARDLLKAGMAGLKAGATPIDEAFVLSTQQLEILRRLVGDQLLIRLGLL